MKNNNELKNKLSVMVATHLVNSHTDNPYYDNEMIITTIKTSHDKLKLYDVMYYVYIDSVCQPNDSRGQVKYDNYLKYKQCLESKIKSEIPNINVTIVEDTARFKANFRHMLDNCGTEYFLFLEHDWEFIREVNAVDIINCMDNNNHINYIKFNRLPAGSSHWDMEEGGCFENETEITDIPLIRLALFSGNPHIMRTDTMKNKYLKWHAERWNDTININPYLERDLFQIATDHIKQFGKHKQHDMWGCFMYGNVESCPVVVHHLGDWCRKQ
jgi:hypothetical protein